MSLSPSTTAGPVMRQVSASQMWREWIVRVEDGSDGNEKKVTLQAFVDPDVGKKAKCLGYMSTFYGTPSYPNACSTPPYGTGVFLNGTKDSSGTTNGGPRVWSVRAVAGSESQGDFELHAYSKPEECARVLSLDGCQGRPTLSMMGSTTNSQGSQIYPAWKFIRQYEMVSTAPPSPPLPPSPSPTPSGPPFIPGTVISGPSTTSSGYATVTIKEVGGGNSCSVGSIVLTSTGGAIGSVPATVEVSSGLSQSVQIPVTTDGYNSIYAVGVCTSGVKTEISNGLSVFSSSPGAAPSYAYPVTFTVVLTGGYTPSQPISDDDLKQMCTNLLTEVPGGVCEVVNNFLWDISGGYDTLVTLTAQYSSNSSVAEIFNEIADPNFTDSLVSGLSGNVESTQAVGLIFALAPQIPVVSTDSVSHTTWTGSFTDTKADEYLLSCSTEENVFGEKTNSPSGFTGTVTGLFCITTYYCSVGTATSAAPGAGYILLLSDFVQIKTDPCAPPPP